MNVFVRVEVAGQIIASSKRFLISVVDTEFVEEIAADYIGPGLNMREILTGIVAAYEKRSSNVAANLALVCKGWKINLNDIQVLDKYRSEIDRYLILA